MQEQRKKRLFIALNLPQNVKDEIFDLINKGLLPSEWVKS